MPGVGDKFKSFITGATYVVKKIIGKMVLMERLNGKTQTMTDLDGLKEFYEKEEDEEKTKPNCGTMNLERRKHLRFNVDLPVEYTRRDWVVKHGRAINASEGGLLVYFPEQMEIGQHLRMNLFLPSGSELNVIEIVNQVVWMNIYLGKGLGDYQTGVRFMDISSMDLNRLKHFLGRISE
jgi:hypothetical protein